MDESVVEGLHRTVSHNKKSSSSVGVPYLSATQTMEELLADYQKHCTSGHGHAHFTWAYRVWKSILQTKGWQSKKALRNTRCGTPHFLKTVFRLGSVALEDYGWVPAGVDVASRRDCMKGVAKKVAQVKVVYLEDVMQMGQCFAIVPRSDDEPVVFQVLADISAKNLISKVDGMDCPRLVQRYRRFNAIGNNVDGVYADEVVETVSLLRMGPFSDLRFSTFQFDMEVSDCYGCMDLKNKRPALPAITDPLHKDVPELLVLEALKSEGWRPGKFKGPHVHGGPKLFALAGGSKHYFQCLLMLPQLVERGLEKLPKHKSIAYYACLALVPNPGALPIDLKAERYDVLRMAALENGPDAFLAIEAPAAEANAFGGHALEDVAVSNDDSDVVVDDFEPPPAPLALADGAANSEAESTRSSDSVNSDVVAEEASSGDSDVVAEEAWTFPSVVEGMQVTFENYAGHVRRYQRYLVKCTEHPDCIGQRGNSERLTRRHGVKEPLAFLSLWAARGKQAGVTREMHKAYKPTAAEIDAWFLADHAGRIVVQSLCVDTGLQ